MYTINCILSYIVCINHIFCWELFGASRLRLGTNEFKTSLSVCIYIIMYMTYIQYIYIYTVYRYGIVYEYNWIYAYGFALTMIPKKDQTGGNL